MTSNTQGDTPPIQPDELEQILFEHGFCFGITAKARREGIAAIELWHQQALERERLEGQIEALGHVDGLPQCFIERNGMIVHMPIDKRLGELRAQLSTLTNKDKDNDK